MSFFDKLKDGASKAADKAKESVEIARLYTQITSKSKEIEIEYQSLGRSIYIANNEGRLETIGHLVKEHCEKIQSFESEIKQIEYKIKAIKNEKDCTCGQIVPLEAQFCPVCGYKFNA